MALLQVAAKMQEMLIDASLAALVIEVIRDDMLYGDGVPLGWIGGGFLFTSLSYFWSADFWCSFSSQIGFWRKSRLYGLLLLTGFIATFAGPSCAVLLIPRIQDWPSGGSEFYLQNSTEELWPESLSFDPNGPEAFCTLSNATYFPGCPSSGYWALRDWMQGHLYSSTKITTAPPGVSKYNCRELYLFRGSHTIVPDIVMTGNGRNRACETSYSTVHLATAVTQEQIARDWVQAVEDIPYTASRITEGEFKYWASLKTSTKARVPTVRVACSEDQQTTASDTDLMFPIMPEYVCWSSSDHFKVFNDTVAPTNTSRASWVSLPARFGSVSTGLVIEAPWANDQASRITIGCSIDARWADAFVSESQIFNDFYTSFGGVDFVGGALSTLADSSCSASRNWSAFTSSPENPWTHIHLDPSWLHVLTPTAPETVSGSNSPNLTTLETLISESILGSVQYQNISPRTPQNLERENDYSLNKTTYLETIIAVLVADGLSRHGSAHLFDTSNSFANWTLTNYDPVVDINNQLVKGGHALKKPVS